jgi:hypothetical protein
VRHTTNPSGEASTRLRSYAGAACVRSSRCIASRSFSMRCRKRDTRGPRGVLPPGRGAVAPGDCRPLGYRVCRRLGELRRPQVVLCRVRSSRLRLPPPKRTRTVDHLGPNPFRLIGAGCTASTGIEGATGPRRPHSACRRRSAVPPTRLGTVPRRHPDRPKQIRSGQGDLIHPVPQSQFGTHGPGAAGGPQIRGCQGLLRRKLLDGDFVAV